MESSKRPSSDRSTDVLLVFCAPVKREMYINTLPPLGILGIASYLESRGIRTDVVDCQIDDFARIDPGAYSVIGFSINIANVESSLALMENIRREHPGTKIVAGGPHCASAPEFFIEKEFIDAVCLQEGEEALWEYVQCQSDISGMYVKSNDVDGYEFTGPREFKEDLDSLPFPALDKVDIRKYSYFPKRHTPISSIVTSRGCPYRCIFCCHSMGQKWRKRSADNVVTEIEWQVKSLGVREIAVYDDNFSLDRKRVIELCDLLVSRGVQVTLQFTNGLRVENLDEEVLTALRRAGTWFVGVAPETGSRRIMALIGKKADLGKIRYAVQLCRKLNIRTFAVFMIGFPGETTEEIEQTIAFARELDTDMVQFARVLAYKGTKLFEMVGPDRPDIGKEMGYFYETEENRAVSRHIRRAYRSFYLRPGKIVGLLRVHSLRDLFSLAWYSLVTRSL